MSKKTVTAIIFGIVILSGISSIVGIMSDSITSVENFQSIYGKEVELYQKGLYAMNSVSVAAQGIASDWVVLVIGIPALIISYIDSKKNPIKGSLFLIGILGFFLYTYMSYVFLWFYNDLFIVYVTLMGMSLFAIAGVISSMDYHKFKMTINRQKPTLAYALVQILVAVGIGFMWLATILPPLFEGSQPEILEHYTTLVIQAMDLGLVIPIALYSSYKLLKKEDIGYFLTPVVLIKGLTMLLAILAMLINMQINEVEVGVGQLVLMPVFCLLFAFGIWRFMRNILKSSNNN